MKALLATFALLFTLTTCSLAATAPADSTGKVTVTINGITKRTGKLLVGLATDNKTLMGQAAINQVIDVPAEGNATVVFPSLKPGRYAVRIVHDLNNNGTMDFSGQMPTEPFGFSNVTMLMGPPEFDQCAFDVQGEKAVQVTMMEL